MNLTTKLMIAGVVAFAGVTFGGVAIAAGGSSPVEDYVNEDGTIDPDKVPYTMTMVDENGDLVLNDAGEPILLDARRLILGEGEPDPVPSDKDVAGVQRRVITGSDGRSEEIVQAPVMSREDVIEQYALNK